MFKEDLIRKNGNSTSLFNISSMRMGINAATTLSNIINTHPNLPPINKLNLADNQITDNGMQAIKKLLQNPKEKPVVS
jgi:hypothetical protein